METKHKFSTELLEKYWNDIRTLFPKSLKVLIEDHNTIEEWGYIDSPEIWGTFVNESHYVLRHLYDFFDMHKIIVCVFYSDDLGHWVYTLKTDTGFSSSVLNTSTKFQSRAEAEFEAWVCAFGSLEIQL